MTARHTGRMPIAVRRRPWKDDRVRVRLEPFPFPFVVLLMIGFTLGVELQFTGTLYLGEIVLALIAVVGVSVNLGNSKFWSRELYWLMIWLTVSYLAYIVTDIFVGTSMTNVLRGWGRMGFLMTDIVGVYVICRKNRYNLFPLVLGLALAALLMTHKETEHASFAVRWKFDLYFPWVSSFCILAAYFGRRRAAVSAVLCLIPAGIISIVLDSRMVGAACITVVVVLLAQMVTARRQRKLLLVVLAVAAIVGGGGTYVLLDQTNHEYAARRAESNVARATAILTALQHIGQHPILGAGSWNVSEAHMNRHRANTSTLGGKQVSTSMALGHSQILQAAVEAGIFGAVFFVYFVLRLIRSLWWVVKLPLDRFSAFAMFNLLMCIWHCLFSPQGGSQRIEIATGVCICLLMAREEKLWRRGGWAGPGKNSAAQ